MTAADVILPDQAPPLLLMEFLYETPPSFTLNQLANRLQINLPKSKVISKTDDAETILIAHENETFELADGQKIHPLTAILRKSQFDPAKIKNSLDQTWDWPEARMMAANVTYQLAVTEMFARMFTPQFRVKTFREVVSQLVEIAPPLAIHCQHAEKIYQPSKLLLATGSGEISDRMGCFLNVRLFRIEGSPPGDMVMDTRGLAALGLPDLQVHFRKLDPKAIATLLYNTALYIYEKGDCLKNGETIQGLKPDQRWRCQHEEALVKPNRLVIDIDPGDPFAAGGRRR
jgi:hypothetical protein